VSNVNEQPCASFEDDLVSIALGIAAGRRREEVLNHLEHCPTCSAELAKLSLVADTLLELAPDVEPPLGFESRLARRLESVRPSRVPTRRRGSRVVAIAAVLSVILGVGLGVLFSSQLGTRNVPSALGHPTEAILSSNGHVVGNVILSSDSTPWMIMTIDKGWWSGTVTCEAVLADGKVETVGTYSLSGAYSAWGAPLTAPVGQVRGARLIAANGTVLASARIRR
jgi:hypothetical protein